MSRCREPATPVPPDYWLGAGVLPAFILPRLGLVEDNEALAGSGGRRDGVQQGLGRVPHGLDLHDPFGAVGPERQSSRIVVFDVIGPAQIHLQVAPRKERTDRLPPL